MPDWTEFLRRRLELPRMRGFRDERMIREIADHLEDIYQDALANGATRRPGSFQAANSKCWPLPGP